MVQMVKSDIFWVKEKKSLLINEDDIRKMFSKKFLIF